MVKEVETGYCFYFGYGYNTSGTKKIIPSKIHISDCEMI